MRDLQRLIATAAGHGPDIGIYAERLLDHDLPWTRMRQVYRLLGLVGQVVGSLHTDLACRYHRRNCPWVGQSHHVDGEEIICRGRRLLRWKRRWQSYSLSEAQELPIAGKRLDVARAQPQEVLVPLRQG